MHYYREAKEKEKKKNQKTKDEKQGKNRKELLITPLTP
jgi:hypothetical protein